MIGASRELEKKKEIFDIQQAKLLEARKKEEYDFRQKQAKYDEVMALKLPDEKLTGAQLKILLSMKKERLINPSMHLRRQSYNSFGRNGSGDQMKLQPFKMKS